MSATVETSRTAQIERLTLEWVAAILEEPQVSPEDNFLDLGGHSTLAVLLAERAKKRFGLEYDLLLLFEKDLATVAAELASRVTTQAAPAGHDAPGHDAPGRETSGRDASGRETSGRDAAGGGDE